MTINCSKGWKDRCPDSKGRRCYCKCGGENHKRNHWKALEKQTNRFQFSIYELIRLVDQPKQPKINPFT